MTDPRILAVVMHKEGLLMSATTDQIIESMSTDDLADESRRLTAMKAWGPNLASIDAELRRRRSVELAQDSYYPGTAADFTR